MSNAAWVVVIGLCAVVAVVIVMACRSSLKRVIIHIPGLRALIEAQPERSASFKDRKGEHVDSDFIVKGDAQVDMDGTRTDNSTFRIEGQSSPDQKP